MIEWKVVDECSRYNDQGCWNCLHLEGPTMVQCIPMYANFEWCGQCFLGGLVLWLLSVKRIWENLELILQCYIQETKFRSGSKVAAVEPQPQDTMKSNYPAIEGQSFKNDLGLHSFSGVKSSTWMKDFIWVYRDPAKRVGFLSLKSRNENILGSSVK